MKTNGTWGGARKGSGPIVRNIHLDKDTAQTLRALVRQRRAVSPDIDEHSFVRELIQTAWSELDQEYLVAAPHHADE